MDPNNNPDSKAKIPSNPWNRFLLSLVCGLGLILVLVIFTEIAGDVLTVIGLIVALVIFLFPGIKEIGQGSWLVNRYVTIGLVICIVIELTALVINVFSPGKVLLRIARIEGAQSNVCSAYCTVILEGQGLKNLKPGTNLLVYGPAARLINKKWSEAPIALIRVVSSYSDNAVAQVILIHENATTDESRQIAPGLRVEEDSGFNTDFLVPTYGDGYIYKDFTVYLRPNLKINVGDRLEVIAPQLKGERIIDFQVTDTKLRVIAVGQNGISAQTELLSGNPPAPGDLVINKFQEGLPPLSYEPKMVLIPSSTYEMGSDTSNADEVPTSIQEIQDFYIAVTEITNSQYKPFIEDGGYSNSKYWTKDGWTWIQANNVTQPKYWNDPLYYDGDRPVVGVSWYEAVAYSSWLSLKTGRLYRLPREAEWERTACGSPKMEYPWGNAWDPSRANFADKALLSQEPAYTWSDSSFNDRFAYTSPVGSYPKGASPEGVLDLAGNVWEWTSSKYQSYPYQANDGREDLNSSSDRVTRGGGWGSEAKFLKCTTRGPQPPSYETFIIGFRLARDP